MIFHSAVFASSLNGLLKQGDWGYSVLGSYGLVTTTVTPTATVNQMISTDIKAVDMKTDTEIELLNPQPTSLPSHYIEYDSTNDEVYVVLVANTFNSEFVFSRKPKTAINLLYMYTKLVNAMTTAALDGTWSHLVPDISINVETGTAQHPIINGFEADFSVCR